MKLIFDLSINLVSPSQANEILNHQKKAVQVFIIHQLNLMQESTRQQTLLSINKVQNEVDLKSSLHISQQSFMSGQFPKGHYEEHNFIKREYMRLVELKEQLTVIRQRKAVLPKVPDPEIVHYFTQMKLAKQRQVTKARLTSRIVEKKKQLKKLKQLFTHSQREFEQKNEIFRQKSALLRVLSGKMETELSKTKQRYREVQFNKVIVQGIRKVLYYRLAEILFNGHTKNIFNVISSIRVNEQKIDEDSIAICLGYLGLFMSLVATICGARMWISFTFRGAKSTIKTNDGSTIILHPRDNRIDEGLKLLNEQLFQLMNDTMQLKIENPHNFYKLCEELSKEILTIK